jgi:hypothetical protein
MYNGGLVQMFKPNLDRLDYGELMAPPDGYRLSRAVGTTYSLDLDTLLGIPVALSFSHSVEVSQSRDRIYILEALRRSIESVKVYCQKGKISVPNKQYALYALLEKMITQVNVDPFSFHPKIWILRYSHEQNAKNIIYRLIVLSRNITFDRSWDVSLCVDGVIGTRKVQSNEPLVDFVKYLTEQDDFEDSQQFMKELHKVNFDLTGKGKKSFESLEFLPIGIPNRIEYRDLLENECSKLFIISPFLTEQTLQKIHRLNKGGKKTILFSREGELRNIKPSSFEGISSYHLKENIVEGETLIQDEESNFQEQDIHAKVYIRENSNQTEMFLGSANCSYNAFHGNVEFLAKLTAGTKHFKVEDVLSELLPEDENSQYFQEYLPIQPKTEVDEEAQIKKQFDQKLRDLCQLPMEGQVEEKENSNYDLIFNTTGTDTLFEIYIEVHPLTTPGLKQPFQSHLKFKNIEEQWITRFFVFECSYKGLTDRILLKIPVSNMPPNREKNILKAIISNTQAFLAYMNFLLGDGSMIDFLEAQLQSLDKEQSTGNSRNPFISKGMFEKMLKAAAKEPHKLRSIGEVIEFFSEEEEIIPEDFKKLYSEFEHFSK